MIFATTEQLLSIACKAIEHQKAKDAVKSAKSAYHMAWASYETGCPAPSYVHQEERICRNHPDFDAACEATKLEYENYKAIRRAEYNAKRRLETAIRGIK